MEGMRHSNDPFSGECTLAGWEHEDVHYVLVLPEMDQNLPVVIQEWMVKRRKIRISEQGSCSWSCSEGRMLWLRNC